MSLLCVIGAAGKTHRSPASSPLIPSGAPSAPVTVGTSGNEPLVTIAPDGTLYISALQHIYRSVDSGTSWTKLPGPIYASTLNVASDSSIWVDPGNRLYFTFDYPYAGTTAVCTSDDKGDTWACNPAVVPGGTDRMWVIAPSTTAAYEVTNQGLYETAFLESVDRGATWTPKAIANGLLEPQSGPLLQKRCSNKIVQPIKVFGTLPSDVPEIKLYVYDPTTTGAILSDVRPTGLGLPIALPAAAFSADGVLYICSEEANAAGGRQVVVARSPDEGMTWTKLPPIPATTTGTATFAWVAAGEPGHIGVLYYYTLDNGSDSGTMSTSSWSVVWAESFNGDTATPTWSVTTLENLIHTGAICAAAGCMGTDRFAGDFINAIIDPSGVAHLTWNKRENGTGPISIRYQRIQSGPPSTYVPLPCGVLPLPVELDVVVSSKIHGGTEQTIELPVTGPHGIECRDGGESNAYTMIFTFVNTLESVESATVSSGIGEVESSSIGADEHQYIVNLTGVANAQHIFVTLHAVQDSAEHSSDVISAPMSVLLGDTTGDGVVNAADITQTRRQSGNIAHGDPDANFREDVTLDGVIDAADITAVRRNSGNALPP